MPRRPEPGPPGGALSAMAVAGLDSRAEAGEVFEMGPSEKANAQLIEDFCKSWGEPNPDPAIRCYTG